MTFRKANAIVGTIGFLVAIFVAIFWKYANAHDFVTWRSLGILQNLTLAICPPSIGLMATEYTGTLGTAIIVTIVAMQNFAIYFLVAGAIGLVWRKSKAIRSDSAASVGFGHGQEKDGEGYRPGKDWRYVALVTVGILLLVGVFAGLLNFIASFGWSWYYVPGTIASLTVSFVCLGAANRIKRTYYGGREN
jgi:hypothetical protein